MYFMSLHTGTEFDKCIKFILELLNLKQKYLI